VPEGNGGRAEEDEGTGTELVGGRAEDDEGTGTGAELVGGRGVEVDVGVGVGVGVGVVVGSGAASPHLPKAGWHPTMTPQC
jgi:hypothetical protein